MERDTWAPVLPPGRTLELPGRGQLFVREVAGPPGAPVVVLLHGWTASSDLNWFPAFEVLGKHFRVVAFDHRGHGRGGIRHWRPFRLTDCADDAVAVADALGIDRFIPVGYSMGGPVAMLAWRRHRERVDGLVLCATATSFADSWLVRMQLTAFYPASLAARFLPERFCRPFFDRLIWSRTRNARLQPWIIDEIRAGDPRLVLEAGSELSWFNSNRWAGDVDVPTAVVVIDHDGIVPTRRQEELAALVPGASTWHVDGDHDVCVRHPDRFTDALLAACIDVRDRIEQEELSA